MPITLDKETQAVMAKVAGGLPTKSAKIRTLLGAGYKRADIARFLDIRYQHVRNVEVRAKERESREARAEATATPPAQVWAQVGPDGRVVIPAAYRPLLGIGDGGHVLMRLEDGELRLIGRDAAIARVQAMVAKYVPEGVSLVDELLAERRREVEREEREEREERKRG